MHNLIITDTGCVIFTNGKPFVINKEHPNYDRLIQAFKNKEWDIIDSLADIEKTLNDVVNKSNNPNLVIKDHQVFYKHVAFPDDLSDYIINMIREKLDLTPYINFMEKLLKNPDHRVFQQLFGFLSYGKNPITPDGNILAYKKVNNDYTSVHDNTTLNAIGTVVELPRDACNSNPEQTCSSGLHFCSREYINHFGGDRIVIVEVSPTDVVSVPVDYNNTKARACRYKIVGELTSSEVVKVSVADVLTPATVVDKYVETSVVEKTTENHTATNDEIDEYLQGYSDGRKKLTKNLKYSVSGFYNDGYRAGRSKKKRKYSEADKV